MNTAKKIDGFLNSIERFLIVGLLAFMVGLSFLQVILRLCFSTSLLWADGLLRHLVLWVGFLGACVATSEGSHFAIDFVRKFIPPRFQKISAFLINALAVAVLIPLTFAAWKFFKDELSSGSILFEIGQWSVPSWSLTLIIPLSFFLLLIHFILKSLSDWCGEDA